MRASWLPAWVAAAAMGKGGERSIQGAFRAQFSSFFSILLGSRLI
jgi:hypothetical protein